MNSSTWDIKVPIFKNSIIIKQFCIAIGIPFGLLIILFVIIKAYYGLLIVALTFLLTFILVMIVFKGTYDIKFSISNKGILCENQSKQAKRVKKLSALTVLLGIFSRNATATGAGMLSGSRTSVFIPFKNVRKMKINEKKNCIMIYGGFAQNIAVFCTEDNFLEVEQLLTDNYIKTEMGG